MGDEPPVEKWFVPVCGSAGAADAAAGDGLDGWKADEGPTDGNEGPNHVESWENGPSHDHEDWAGDGPEEEWALDGEVDLRPEEPWVPNGYEDPDQAEQWDECWAADDEQQLTAEDEEPWPVDDPSHQVEPWKASDDHGPNDDEKQWKAADDEGPNHDDEQRKAADDEGANHDDEQWKAADDEGPNHDEEQWKAADDEGPNHDEWKAADDDEGPNHEEEQWKAAVDDEDPNHDGTSLTADEEWAVEAAVCAETESYPTWPRAPITNVTQEYPTTADRERLDVWWSKYKTNPAEEPI